MPQILIISSYNKATFDYQGRLKFSSTANAFISVIYWVYLRDCIVSTFSRPVLLSITYQNANHNFDRESCQSRSRQIFNLD